MKLKGIVLTQEQVKVIRPILEERVNLHHMSRKQFEAKCVAAMAAAGCPLEEETDVSVGDLYEVTPRGAKQ